MLFPQRKEQLPIVRRNKQFHHESPNISSFPKYTKLYPSIHIKSAASSLQCQYPYYWRTQSPCILISTMRCHLLLAAFLVPLSTQAFVQFTNAAFYGITAGSSFTLTWSGDGSVRSHLCRLLLALAQPFRVLTSCPCPSRQSY